MKFDYQLMASAILSATFLCGCAALSTDGTKIHRAAVDTPSTPQASPAFRAQNHHHWVKRLKIAKPVESLKDRMPTPATSSMMPIPLPPTSQQQYGLVIDQHQQLAWLRGDHDYGPFPLTNPDVTHLVRSIQGAWQEQQAWQAAAAQQMAQAFQQQAEMSGESADVKTAGANSQFSAGESGEYPDEFSGPSF